MGDRRTWCSPSASQLDRRNCRALPMLCLILVACQQAPPVETPPETPGQVQLRTMSDSLFEVLKPEIDKGTITVERGNFPRVQSDQTTASTGLSQGRNGFSPAINQTRPGAVQSHGAAASDSRSDLRQQAQGTTDYLRIKLSDRVLFESGDDHLTPDGHLTLTRVAEILKSASDVEIQVEGHTDNVPISTRLRPRFADNMQLSKSRALNTLEVLKGGGVNEAYLSIRWYGESRPVASNTTEQGRSRNRRVEILVIAP